MIPARALLVAALLVTQSVPAQQTLRDSATALFNAGDHRAALDGYQAALARDSTLYHAALFSADTYIHLGPTDSMFAWYRRATELEPGNETAWRYWSYQLDKQGEADEAMLKALQAVIAEPYTRIAWDGITRWTGRRKIPLGFPPVGIDPNGGDSLATPAQQAFDSVRAAFAAGGAEPRTRFIGDLDAAGMLEPFILFARADEGIAEDFPGYRAGNAQQLRLFLLEWFVGAGRNRPKPATQP